MNISEVYERIRERESGASAESRTRAELHIQKIKELREKHKAFIKMSHTKACDMINTALPLTETSASTEYIKMRSGLSSSSISN